ncbi:putative membrane protein [Synechococcus sp. A15-62]|nr:putative membrane protein [Synechococcus sp. A15-62]
MSTYFCYFWWCFSLFASDEFILWIYCVNLLALFVLITGRLNSLSVVFSYVIISSVGMYLFP